MIQTGLFRVIVGIVMSFLGLGHGASGNWRPQGQQPPNAAQSNSQSQQAPVRTLSASVTTTSTSAGTSSSQPVTAAALQAPTPAPAQIPLPVPQTSTAPTTTTTASTSTVTGPVFTTTQSTSDTVAAQTYVQSVLTNPYTPLVAVYIPRYAYFQGLAYSKGDLTMVGQIRAIGGVVSEGKADLRNGAMGTTDPEYLKNRLQPSGARYQIVEWKEVQ